MVNTIQGPKKPKIQETQETSLQANLVNSQLEGEKQAVDGVSKEANLKINSIVSNATPDSSIQTPNSEAQTEEPNNQIQESMGSQVNNRLMNAVAAIPQRVEDGTATWVERSLQNIADNCEKQGIEIENMTFLNKTKFIGLMALFIIQNRYRLR